MKISASSAAPNNLPVAGIFRILIIGLLLALSACGKPKESPADKGIILGFSQIGAESAWRTCHTRSIQDAAAEAGVQLLFSNAEQKQENQIKAIRSFIAYQVDVIVFVPHCVHGVG